MRGRGPAWLALRVVALAMLAAAGVAASAWAATIHGTPHADTLRGSVRADVIHGGAGNDKIYGGAGNDKLYGDAGNDTLYGGPGNDLLVGGPGHDVLNCGPGHDTAIRDAGDRVIGCEVVKGSGPTTSTTTATTTTVVTTTVVTTTTATTTTTPAVTPQAGLYCGFTNNGGSFCFTVTNPPSPQYFSDAKWTVTYDSGDCSPTAQGTVDYTSTGDAPIAPDGSFDYSFSSGELAGTAITGTVDSAGGASGNLNLHDVLTSNGTTFTCSLNTTWTAKRQ